MSNRDHLARIEYRRDRATARWLFADQSRRRGWGGTAEDVARADGWRDAWGALLEREVAAATEARRTARETAMDLRLDHIREGERA